MYGMMTPVMRFTVFTIRFHLYWSLVFAEETSCNLLGMTNKIKVYKNVLLSYSAFLFQTEVTGKIK